jgi:hypothetical protein
MELISVADKKIVAAFVNENILTIRLDDGSTLRAISVVRDGKPFLEIIR